MITVKKRIDFYILSIGLLFLLMIPMLITIPEEANFASWAWYLKCVTDNTIPLLCVLLLLYSVYVYWRFVYFTSGSADIPRKCPSIRQINYEPMTFLITFILPLISLDFEKKQSLFILVVILLAIGIICIKTDLLYKNPSLVLLGFSIYKSDNAGTAWGKEGEVIFICRGSIKEGQDLLSIQISEGVFFVRSAVQ